MDRRSYLQTLVGTTAGTTALAGCLGDGNENTILGKPKRKYGRTSEQIPYLAWGERIPKVSIPAPLVDRKIAIRSIETPTLFTFIYTHCPDGVCTRLISALRNVQAHSVRNGYADEVTFLPITFDPVRDDAERLRTWAQTMHINLSVGNWHFLRPPSRARAQEVVEDKFGVMFDRQSIVSGLSNRHGSGTHIHRGGYMFIHAALTMLVNADGYVERAYRTKSPDPDTLIADLKKVR